MARNIAYGHCHRYGDCGIQTGVAEITPTANAVSTMTVTFPEAFKEVPDCVLVSPKSAVPYTTLRYATASDYTTTGFDLHIYRTSATTTTVTWVAFGKMK